MGLSIHEVEVHEGLKKNFKWYLSLCLNYRIYSRISRSAYKSNWKKKCGKNVQNLKIHKLYFVNRRSWNTHEKVLVHFGRYFLWPVWPNFVQNFSTYTRVYTVFKLEKNIAYILLEGLNVEIDKYNKYIVKRNLHFFIGIVI